MGYEHARNKGGPAFDSTLKHFLNQACAAEGRARLVSWNCFGSRVSMCVCVCACVCVRVCVCASVSIPEGINNQLCDIGHVWLVKQALQLSPAFNYFLWHLPSIEWMGVAILTQHIMNVC